MSMYSSARRQEEVGRGPLWADKKTAAVSMWSGLPFFLPWAYVPLDVVLDVTFKVWLSEAPCPLPEAIVQKLPGFQT